MCRDFLAEAVDSTERVKDLLEQPLQAGQDRDSCSWKKWVSDYDYYSHNRKNSLIDFDFFIISLYMCQTTKPGFFFLIKSTHKRAGNNKPGTSFSQNISENFRS